MLLKHGSRCSYSLLPTACSLILWNKSLFSNPSLIRFSCYFIFDRYNGLIKTNGGQNNDAL